MTGSAGTRLAASFVALLLPAVATAYVRLAAPSHQLEFDAGMLPKEFGALELAQEERLEPDVLAQVNPAAYSFRLYTNPERTDGIWSYVAFYRGRDGAGAHDPEVCYPAQGWEVVDRGQSALTMPDGAPFQATWLRAYLSGREELVLHWFQPVGRWPGSPFGENFLRVIDSVRGQPQYAFVRLSTSTLDPDVARAQLEDFAVRIAPAVRDELER